MESVGLTRNRPLFTLWPQIAGDVDFVDLAALPTPVCSLDPVTRALGLGAINAFEKRDDQSSPVYGGNKVRTLEVLFGLALRHKCSHVFSTGAYGSNHAAASLMHAPRAGLVPGAVLYPQPPSPPARENLRLLISHTRAGLLRDLPHWSALPYGMIAQWAANRVGQRRAFIMEPGGAVPHGALGYVSAALELAQQVRDGELPAPTRIVVAAGSNCTAAGLLLGTRIAQRLGIGFREPPRIVAVRVTPWPVTIPLRIVGLAHGASRLLQRMSGDDRAHFTRRQLRASLMLDTRFIGRGYGFATAAGREALALFDEQAGHALDTTYSGKAAAAFLAGLADEEGPTLYWSTKSSAPLPPIDDATVHARGPRRMSKWLRRA